MLGALLLVRFADELFGFLPAGTLPQIRAEMHLSYAQAGLLLAMPSVGGILGLPMSLAADHVSRRALASAGALAVGICFIGFGASPVFAGIAVAAFLWGAASDAFNVGSSVALVDISGRHLTAALSRANLLSSVGDLLSPALLAFAAAVGVGWRWLFAGSGGLMLGYAAWLAASPLPPPHPSAEKSVARGVVEVIRDGRVWLLATAQALLALVDEPYLAFLILFLLQVRGIPTPVGILVAMADLAGAALGSMVAAVLLERRPRTVMTACGVGMAVGLGVLITATSLPAMFIAAALSGICSAIVWVGIDARVLGLRPGQAGATIAVVSAIGLVEIPVPAVVGLVADNRGLFAAMSLYVGVVIVMTLLMPAVGALRPGDDVVEDAEDAAEGRATGRVERRL
jgi:predicted MFS family arabinose efflux permease